MYEDKNLQEPKGNGVLPCVSNSASQVEIVRQRLHYHFLQTDGTWDIPKDMPFMKEFLNEVKKLCDIVS